MEVSMPVYESGPVAKRLIFAVLLASVLAVAGCDYLPFTYTPIGEIAAAPAKFEGQEVRVQGKVRDSLKILGMKAFTLQDETGSLVVTTSGEVPAAGVDAAVRGTVRSAIIIGGSAVGLRLEERARLR